MLNKSSDRQILCFYLTHPTPRTPRRALSPGHASPLEQRLLLFRLSELPFEFLDPLAQTLIFQPQHIQPIEQLFTLDLGPFKSAFEPSQFKLSRSLVRRTCHRRPQGIDQPAAL
jgi:hypothetical protein